MLSALLFAVYGIAKSSVRYQLMFDQFLDINGFRSYMMIDKLISPIPWHWYTRLLSKRIDYLLMLEPLEHVLNVLRLVTEFTSGTTAHGPETPRYFVLNIVCF